MSDLPDKPSELIRLAVADLEKVENSPDYVIDMACWHEPMHNNKCAVCFAGAVMAGTLGHDPCTYIGLDSIHANKNDQKLFGLDSLQAKLLRISVDHFARASMITAGHAAALGTNQHLNDAVSALPSEYYESPEKFKSVMHRIADLFERYGD